MAALTASAKVAQKQPAADPDRLWADLAGADSAAAFTATWVLAEVPEKTLPLLKQRLHPVPHPDPKQVRQWLDDLQSDSFAVRDKATRALEKLGELVEPEVRAALVPNIGLEKRRRLELLLRRIEEQSLTTEELRALRAVEVLERIGSPEALAILEHVATGAPGARLTYDARRALIRMRSRAPLD